MHSKVLALVAVVVLTFGISSCKRSKQITRETGKNPAVGDTTLATQDTTESELSQQYDSLSNKVSGFLKSLLPPSTYTPKGGPVLTAPPPSPSPMVNGEASSSGGFLPSPVKPQVEFDSAGYVTEREMFLGGDVRDPNRISFEDYLHTREENEMGRAFRDMLHKAQDTGKTVEASTGLLGDYGNIQVPIPPSIVPTIFGRPSINLRVSGDVAIHLAYRDNQTYATSGVGYVGSETGLDFKQEINVSTNGTIGDKLKIGADWGSDRMFQFDNLLKLGYTGFPDEILQSFEAGNVNLVTPSQYIGTQEALFGFKAVTRFGPLYVTTLAAQKKGERQTRSFGGGPGGPAVEHVIKPYEYRRNMYFLDTTFRKNYEEYYSTIPPVQSNIGRDDYLTSNSSAQVSVWVSTTNLNNIKRKPAIAWYNLQALPNGSARYGKSYHVTGTSDTIFSSSFLKLDTNSYHIDQFTGVLVLNQEPSDDQAIAVSYATTRGRFGENDDAGDTLILKLIKPQYLLKLQSASPAWKNMLKNSYYLGGANFDAQNFTTRIVYQNPNGKQVEYIRTANKPLRAISVLGLDRVNNTNAEDRTPDGLVDYGGSIPTSFIVDSKTGTLTFPYLEPFGSHLRQYLDRQKAVNSKYIDDPSFYLPEIYTTSPDILRQREYKVSINAKFSGGVSSTLNLNAFNLVEGSVKVTVNGTPLVEQQDYRVDYNSGTVTILRPDLVNTGNINVEYDVHDIFTNATKNVLGLRGELPIPDHGLLGLSLMNYSMHLPALKTRQGEEPLSNWILGLDGSYKVDAPAITDALNYLPFFNLKDKSELTVRADAALSLPNPNTQTSPIPEDNGASIAYLDDFEGGKNQFPLYMSYGRWGPASQPLDSSYLRRYLTETFYDSLVNRLKGRTYWYENTGVDIHDIKPNQQTVNPSEQAQVLQMIYDPTKPGIYNYQQLPNGTDGITDTDRWGGMMQYAPGLNVQATNTDAIEVWLNVDYDQQADPNPILRFDLGRISEDVIPDKQLETEDTNGNGKYDPGEDLGLDRLDDDGERRLYPNADDHDDPMHDDYNYTTNGPVDRLNGQQGNEGDAKSGYKPDAEDLDENGSVNLDNNYYEYEIPLNMSKYVIGHNNKWYQLRIPLADFRRIVGVQDSSFSNIAYYRLWMKGVNKQVSVQIHELVLAGSQWLRSSTGISSTNPVGDSSLRIGYVDIQDNANAPTNYHQPDGVQREQLPGQTNYILGDEQSLNMMLTNVCRDSTIKSARREAVRVFPSPNDIFNYRALAIFVHGDENQMPKSFLGPADTLNKVWVYLRMGTDDFNYYEYRRPLLANWQNIHIDFATLTNLKASRTANTISKTISAGDGVAGATLTVVGDPTFTDAPTFTLGVENETPSCLTTNVWWDEMRLLDANDKADFAYNASTNLKLAEFGNISAAIVNERPDFHRVDERFNVGRALNLNWNVTGEFNMEKMLPKWMEDRQTKLHLTVSHSEAIIRPKYIANTDVDLNGAIDALQQQINNHDITQSFGQYVIDSLRLNNETLQIHNSIGASQIDLRFPGSFFLIPAFVNRLSFGFGYGEDFLRSPQFEYNRAWSWTGSVRYSLPQLPNWQLPLLSWIGSNTVLVGNYSGFRITPFPSLVSFAFSTTRGRTHTLDRLSTLSLPPEGSLYEDTLEVLRGRVPIINRVFNATRGMAINWKPFEGGFLSPAFEYTLDVTSNLAPLETRQEFNREIGLDVNGNPIYNYDSIYSFQRDFSDILHDIFLKNGALVRPGDDYNASQRVHMSTSPRLPTLFGLEKLVRPVFDYRVEYRWQDAQTHEQDAKQAAWNNAISTGLEFNVRELGNIIFGKPADDESAVPRGRGERGRVDSRDVGIKPEELPRQGREDRDSPPSPQRNETRNQVDRGEQMRPQSLPNPLGRKIYITDTLPNGRLVTRIDTDVIHSKGIGTAGRPDHEYVVDTTLTPEAPEAEAPVVVENTEPEAPPITMKKLLQTFIQKPLFDWNGTRFNFTQTNQSLNGAIAGSASGITNFLARGIFSPEDDANGPSRAYQLGLITDPSGRLLIRFKPQFPFVQFDVRHGLRAPNPRGETVDITDAFTQQNNFELATSRPLWAGASITLNWKAGFSYDARNTLRIQSDGTITPLYLATTGDVSRTFFSIPPLPFINASQSGILRVGEKYRQMVEAEGIAEGRTGASRITIDNARDSLPPAIHNTIEREAFMSGFETLPFFSGMLREYLPRLNYSFSWTGLEKFPLFSFADRASVRNAYNGTYRRQFHQNPGEDVNLTALQTIVYGFRPLIALDLSWDKIMNGRLTTSLNYDTQTEWASDYSSNRITKRLSTTIGITANYQRQGVSIPFLKLNLKNEFGASFTFSETIAGDSYYNFWTIDPNNPDGTSNGGLTKTTIEPRVTYTVSQQLTLEGFYRYERTTPAASALTSPPTRLIMAGVDIRLKIQ